MDMTADATGAAHSPGHGSARCLRSVAMSQQLLRAIARNNVRKG